MALETGTYIDDLDSANPTATDNVSQGDDHIRLIKSTVKATFPNITGAMNATETEINNVCDGALVGQTWTPKLQDSSASDAEGQTYSTQNGYYSRVGDIVFFTATLVMSGLGTLSGNTRIEGLPVVADATAGASVVNIRAVSLGITAGYSVVGRLVAATNHIELELWDATGGVTALQISEVTGATRFDIAGHYFV